MIFAVMAMILISPLDYFQVLAGVRTLGTNPGLTPLKFAAVGGVLGVLSQWIDPWPHPARTPAVAIHAVMFAVAYLLTLLFPPFVWFTWVALALCLASQQVISLSLQEFYHVENEFSIWEVIPFIIFLGTVGPLVEWIEVRMGGFEYTSAPGTVPLWLPLLWMNGAYLVRALVGKTRKL